MTKCVGAAIPGLALMFAIVAAIDPASAAASRTTVQTQHARSATDLGARQRYRHRLRYAYRAYERSYYLDRPVDYVPAPYVPLNYGYPLWPW
jgi:hypothetical protein